MRAGPLSDPKVVSLLNSYFVPVYVSNEDFREGGAASVLEVAERERIFRQGHEAKLSVGTVHVYILSPEGDLIDSLHVANAAKTGVLVAALERAVQTLKLSPGEPVIAPASQSQCPEGESGSLVFHLAARSLKPGGAWGDYPAENWIKLPEDDWVKLLPAKDAAAGSTWELDRDAAARLLVHFYPATENNDVKKNQIDEQSLKATVLSSSGGVVRARLDGHLKMKHDFYHKSDGRTVDAVLVGLAEFDAAKGRIKSFRLVTDDASYGPGTFGVALRLMQ